jgi:hypothetical protein
MAEPARKIEPEETKADALVLKSEAKIETFKAQVREIVTVKEDGSFLATITTAEQFTLSDTVKKLVEDEKKIVLADIQPLVDDAHALHKKLVAKREAAIAPYDALRNALISGGTAYVREEKRKADEAAAALREQARKEAEEAALREAEELEAEGRTEEAEEVISAPISYVAPAPVSTVPKFDGRAYKAAPVYKAKVTNRMTFLAKCPPDVLLMCLNEAAWTAIESGLSRKAKALGKAFAMQGTEVYEA